MISHLFSRKILTAAVIFLFTRTLTKMTEIGMTEDTEESAAKRPRPAGGPMTDFARASIRDAMAETVHPDYPTKTITISALAKVTGIPVSTVRQFMNGRVNVISLDDLDRIASALGRTPADLLLAPHLRQVFNIVRGMSVARINAFVELAGGSGRTQ